VEIITFQQFYMSGGAILSFLLFIYLSLVNFICLVGQFYPFCCLFICLWSILYVWWGNFILFAVYLSVFGQFYMSGGAILSFLLFIYPFCWLFICLWAILSFFAVLLYGCGVYLSVCVDMRFIVLVVIY